MFGRATRGWGQLALQVTLLLVGLGMLQVLAERTSRRFDLTPTRALSLSPVTKNVMTQVDGPLQITVFFRRGTREQYAALLDRLRAETPHLTYELLDLDRYPERGRSLGVTKHGQASITYQGRHTVAMALPEEQLAGGILNVVRGRQRRVLFTTGHGERQPGGDQRSLGRLVSSLDTENYRADPISLADGPIPEDADLIVVAGPQLDFQPNELRALAAYLKGGGGVLLLLDPVSLPNLSAMLASIGIRLGDDIVYDPEKRVLGTDGLAAIVENFRKGNPISEPANNPIESGVVLPSARTVDVTGQQVPGVAAESIARTGESAWAMTDLDRARRGETPSIVTKDEQGPLSLMVVAEVGAGSPDDRRGRLVVIGDTDFATDAYLDVLGNRDVIMNALAWASHEGALAGDRPADAPEVQRPLSPLVLTEAQAHALLVGVAVVQPAFVLVLGLVLVGMRRRRG
jgi:ABC-type uncharacterized transport system involved in gliding motility auxiliary subunit